MQYVNKWEPEHRDRFAATVGIILSQGLASAACLQSLTKDHLVKNGKSLLRLLLGRRLYLFFYLTDISVNVLTVILRSYIAETPMDHVAGALKKGGIKDLLIFFPPNKRSDVLLDAHFRSAGLPQVADWWTRKQNARIKEEITKAIKEALERDDQPSDVRPNSYFTFFFFWFLGLLKVQGNRSSLLCKPLLRSVRSLRPNLSGASGRALWLRSTGAHARIKSRASPCAKSRCVGLPQLAYRAVEPFVHDVALRAYH